MATPAQPARQRLRRDARGSRRALDYRQLPTISPSGKQLATLDKDERTINLWDVTTGKAIGALRGHEGPVSALAYSPDGQRLASGSADKTIRLWDAGVGKRSGGVARA